MRLFLHTAAYWLMLSIRTAIPRLHPLARAEFATLHLRLLKLAARITETATRARIAFATTCPEAALFRSLANALCYQPPWFLGQAPSSPRTSATSNAQHIVQPDTRCSRQPIAASAPMFHCQSAISSAHR